MMPDETARILEAVTELKAMVGQLQTEVKLLQADRYPRRVGFTEACSILGIGRTTMTKRLQEGYYPFAYRENGRWYFHWDKLQRTAATAAR